MSSAVIVEELDGQRRKVFLVGAGLPIQGAEWGDETTMVTTWNPGNVEATQQVLGPRELPSEWEFQWRTNRLVSTPIHVQGGGEDQDIVTAYKLALLMQDIFRAGQLLRVTWTATTSFDETFRQVRVGRSTTRHFKFDRPDDIVARITFDWIGRGAQQTRVGSLKGGGDLDARNAAMRASEAVARAIIENEMRRRDYGVAASASTFTLGQLEALVDGPRQLVDSMARFAGSVTNRVRHIGELINTIRETPAAIASRTLDVANDAISVTTNFIDVLSRESPEQQSANIKVSNLIMTARYYGGAQRHSDLMVGSYLDLADQSRTRRSSLTASAGDSRRGDLMRARDSYEVYVPAVGETFQSVALRFYGDAELSNEIAVANGFPGYTVTIPRTMPLIVPNRTALDNAARDKV